MTLINSFSVKAGSYMGYFFNAGKMCGILLIVGFGVFGFASGRTEVRRVGIHFKDDLIATIKADPLPEGDEANDPMLPGGRPAAAARR